MKKIFLILPVLALTACDRPTTSVELECRLTKDWQNPVSLLRTNEDYKDMTPVLVDVKTYQNHAILVVNGKESTLFKINERRDMGEFGRVHTEYQGIFPDTNRLATFSFYGDIASKTILQFDLGFDGEYVSHDGKTLSRGYSCTPTKKEYVGNNWSANVPWNHDYKMPNKIEKCINTIVDTVSCDNEECNRLYIAGTVYCDNEECKSDHHYLTAEAAIKISPNWDYSNMRTYVNDGKLEEHEKDACEVVDRLFKYIDEAGLNN